MHKIIFHLQQMKVSPSDTVELSREDKCVSVGFDIVE